MAAEEAPLLSLTSLLSLSAVASLLALAHFASRYFLPSNAPKLARALFLWHAFDASVHFTLEASFLYDCFFVSVPRPAPGPADTAALLDTVGIADVAWSVLRGQSMTPLGTFFLGQRDRLYGAFYGDGVLAVLWQEYARADRRWGGADLTVVSLELLTVFVMAPISILALYYLSKGQARSAAFWMVVVATGELYGGFMTFAPEWLTGSPNLDGSSFMHMWVYLFFMNMLWVVFPLWVLRESFTLLTATAPGAAASWTGVQTAAVTRGAAVVVVEEDTRKSR